MSKNLIKSSTELLQWPVYSDHIHSCPYTESCSPSANYILLAPFARMQAGWMVSPALTKVVEFKWKNSISTCRTFIHLEIFLDVTLGGRPVILPWTYQVIRSVYTFANMIHYQLVWIELRLKVMRSQNIDHQCVSNWFGVKEEKGNLGQSLARCVLPGARITEKVLGPSIE